MKALAALLLAGTFAGLPLSARSCPPLPSDAQLQQFKDEEQKSGYAQIRWFKCGWSEAAPLITRWLDNSPPLPAQPDDEELPPAVFGLFMTLAANPPQLWSELEEELDPDDERLPQAIRELIRFPVSSVQILRNFEHGLEPAVKLLQEQPALPPVLKLDLELTLIAQQVRQGQVDQARARLARAALDFPVAAAADADVSPLDESHERLNELRAVLAEPAAYSAAAVEPLPAWNRVAPRRPGCGFGAAMEATFGFGYLRKFVLQKVDIDTAIADLLRREWRQLAYGSSVHSGLLVELLHKRYSAAQLRQEWEDALAGIRVDDSSAGLPLFGHWLPLPREVIEPDPAAPTGEGRQRPLQPQELAEFVKNMRLYKTLAGASGEEGS